MKVATNTVTGNRKKIGKTSPVVKAVFRLHTSQGSLLAWFDQRLGLKVRPRFWMVFTASALVTVLMSQYLTNIVGAPLVFTALMAADFLAPLEIYTDQLSRVFASSQNAWNAFASTDLGSLAPGQIPVDWWTAFIWNNLIWLMHEPVLIGFVSVVGILLGSGGLIAWIRRPDHLTVSQAGFQLDWQGKAWSLCSPDIPWDELTRVYVKTSNLFGFLRRRFLCFEFKDETVRNWWPRTLVLGRCPVVRIGVDRLAGGAELSRLLKLIETRGEKAAVEPGALDVLAPGMGGSYTQLWLKALESPATEKSERVLPSPVDSLRHDGRYKIDRVRTGEGFVREYDITMVGQPAAESDAQRVLVEYKLCDQSEDSGTVDDFSAFLSRGQRLRSKAIRCLPAIHDCFIENQCGYLLLSYPDGTCLRKIVASNGRQTIERAIKLVAGLCDSVKELHEMEPPMVAVLISPDRLVLTSDERLVLTGFDPVGKPQMLAKTGSGCSAYMAPEILKGKVSQRSDIFSVGAVLYFLLTGCDPTNLASMHPRTEVEEIGPQLDSIVARATQLNPDSRYRSLGCLMADLDII